MAVIRNGFNKLFCSQTRISWRRLAVFSSSCAFLYVGKIEPAEWVTIAIVYIAGDSLPAALGALKK
tara:strand:- start:1992 stop:2189 length:198 start_codon:yes stop_codon:yes gene_type:complete